MKNDAMVMKYIGMALDISHVFLYLCSDNAFLCTYGAMCEPREYYETERRFY